MSIHAYMHSQILHTPFFSTWYSPFDAVFFAKQSRREQRRMKQKRRRQTQARTMTAMVHASRAT